MINNEKGFVLIAAILACLILLAVGLLVINMSGGDLIASSVNVGQKKAMAAVESGIHRLMQADPDTWASNTTFTDCSSASPTYVWNSISGGADSNTKYAVCIPTASSQAPVPIPGYNISDWAIFRYDGSVMGKSDAYNSYAVIGVGVGFGPVPIGGK